MRIILYNEEYTRYEYSYPILFWNKIRAGKVLKALKPKTNDIILDIGCGSGGLVRQLMEHSQNVFGIDINHSALKRANMQNLLCMDTVDIGFPDSSFDKITCVHSIEHVQGIGIALKEMSRILKPTGLILLIYPFEIIRGISAIGTALAISGSISKARELHIHKLYPRKINGLIAGNGLSFIRSNMFLDPWPAFLTILKKDKDKE